MKHSRLYLARPLVAFLSLFLLLPTSALADSRQRVAVLDFQSKVENNQRIGEAVAENLRTRLIQSGAFRVIERSQIDKAIKEIGFASSGFVDQSNAAKAGKLIGADVVIIGSVVRLGRSLTINSRFVDVQQGDARYAESVEGQSESDLPDLIEALAKRIAKAFPLQGTVIELESGNRVYIDLGSEQGIDMGDMLALFRSGTAIKDAAGKVLGMKEESLGTLKVVGLDAQFSVGECTLSKGVVVRKGDRVRFGKLPTRKPSPKPQPTANQHQDIPISF